MDKDGNPIGPEIRCGKGSVRTPVQYHADGGTFTHIRPREDGWLGGTFILADMQIFANRLNTTERAKAKEGTYSISKINEFDANGFLSFVRKTNRDFNNNVETIHKKLSNDYRNNKITYDDYLKQYAKSFNSEMVKLHNTYKSGDHNTGTHIC